MDSCFAWFSDRSLRFSAALWLRVLLAAQSMEKLCPEVKVCLDHVDKNRAYWAEKVGSPPVLPRLFLKPNCHSAHPPVFCRSPRCRRPAPAPVPTARPLRPRPRTARWPNPPPPPPAPLGLVPALPAAISRDDVNTLPAPLLARLPCSGDSCRYRHYSFDFPSAFYSTCLIGCVLA